MKYYLSKIVAETNFADIEARVIDKLKEQGFGIVTQIDMQATLKTKIDKDFHPYKILGACNPNYAFKALSAEDKIGVMLPCNVCLQQLVDGTIEVFAVNPLVAMNSIQNPDVEMMAQEITQKLQAAINAL